MDNSDKIAERMALLALDVYKYASDHELDFTNETEVKNILIALKVTDIDEINTTALIEGIVALNRITKDYAVKSSPKMNN